MRVIKVQGSRFKVHGGFTLVELIIVMSVVAILSAMTITISVTGNLQKGRDGRRKTDLEAIRSALEIYRSDKGTYLTSTQWTTQPYELITGGYMSSIPMDPKTGTMYTYIPTCGTKCTSYSLCTVFEKDTSDPCVSNP